MQIPEKCATYKALLLPTGIMRKKGLFYGLLALIIVFFIFWALIKMRSPADLRYCKSDGDCVPATCCHPPEVVNIKYAPDCRGMVCTEICEGPLDCGAGRIECIDSECRIIPANAQNSNQ